MQFNKKNGGQFPIQIRIYCFACGTGVSLCECTENIEST